MCPIIDSVVTDTADTDRQAAIQASELERAPIELPTPGNKGGPGGTSWMGQVSRIYDSYSAI